MEYREDMARGDYLRTIDPMAGRTTDYINHRECLLLGRELAAAAMNKLAPFLPHVPRQ